MWKLTLLILSIITHAVNGASIVSLNGQESTLEDVKEYIEPIIFKNLQTPGDSAVVQQAKALTSQFLVDTLLDSVKNDAVRPEHFARQVSSVNNNGNAAIAIPTLRPVLNLNFTTPRSTPSPDHVVFQVDQILNNVNGGNITGIVDQALLINTSPPVRQLVNGIMNLVFCNPFNRLWNRCYGGGGIFGRELN